MKKVLLALLCLVAICLLFVSCAGGGSGGGIVIYDSVVQYLEQTLPVNELMTSVSWELGGDVEPVLKTFDNESQSRESNQYITFTDQTVGKTGILKITFNLSEDSVLVFKKMQKTGSNSNQLNFAIDGKSAGKWYWSGEEGEVVRRLSKGEHTLDWEYTMGILGDGHKPSDFYAAIKDIRIVRREGYNLGKVVTFADDNLKAAVLWTLGLSEMIASDLRNIPDLTLENSDKSLYLEGVESNSVKLEARRYVRNLVNEVYEREIDDVIYLDAGNSNITSIEGINQIDKLNMLFLNDNNITDISFLENLTKLRYLALSNNNISNIEVFNHLINEESDWWFITLDYNDVRDLTPLQNLTTLDRLSIRYNENIVDFTPLSNLVELTFLNLNGTGVSDISFLASLSNLKVLGAAFNNITNISVFEQLVGLTGLSIFNNNISDFSSLASLVNLEWLALGGYDVTPEIFNACDNMTKLREFYFYYSNLEDLSFLREHEVFRNLEIMWLYDNNISDIRDINFCSNIQNLSFRKNDLVDISPLSAVTSLDELYLQENKIESISPLVDNTGLGNGDEVDVGDNALDLSEGSAAMTAIYTLEDRGVNIHY